MSRLVWLAVAALAGEPEKPARLSGVAVERVVLDLRIVNGSGRALRALTPAELRVKVDGRDVSRVSLHWVGGDAHPVAAAAGRTPGRAADTADDGGRLVVFLFQKDLQPTPSRIRGLVRATPHVAALADALGPRDRAAVLVFDSHLRLHQDFTADRSRLSRAIRRSVLFEWPATPLPGAAPSLAAHLDLDAARRAAVIDTGLLVLGEALGALPGPKSIVLVGWGLGRLTGGSVRSEKDYAQAHYALVRARATVFALDVTEADSHSLEVGLRQVADDTGGFYAKTYGDALDRAKTRLSEALAGHYVVSFDRPPGPRGRHRVDVRLVGRRGSVIGITEYVD
jgi:VWFA-related protein